MTLTVILSGMCTDVSLLLLSLDGQATMFGMFPIHDIFTITFTLKVFISALSFAIFTACRSELERKVANETENY